MDVFFFSALALFIGWNIPQPAWAKALQAKVVAFLKAQFNRQ